MVSDANEYTKLNTETIIFCAGDVSEWVSSFLTALQHIKGYIVQFR